MQQSAKAATAAAAAASAAAAPAAEAAEDTETPKAPYIEEVDVATVAKRFPFLNLCSTTSSASQTHAVDNSDLGATTGSLQDEGSGYHPLGSGQPRLEATKACAWVESSASAGGRTGAGWVSARKLLEAQQAVFQRRGGTWLREGVDKVEPRMLDEAERGTTSSCWGSSDCGSGSSEKRDSLKMFKVCSTGQFYDEVAGSCVVCPEGAFNNDTQAPSNCEQCASSACAKCPDGAIVSEDRTECTSCSAGYFSYNSTTCVACPLSTYAPTPRVDACIQCPGGFAPGVPLAATSCPPCEAGKYTSG